MHKNWFENTWYGFIHVNNLYCEILYIYIYIYIVYKNIYFSYLVLSVCMKNVFKKKMKIINRYWSS